NRVTIMRRGRVVLERPLGRVRRLPGAESAVTEDELARAIMGGEPPPPFKPPPLDPEAPLALEVSQLVLTDASSGRRLLDGVDVGVQAGEIVGVAGVEGNGQRELVRVLTGLEPRARGRIRIAGREVSASGGLFGPRARRSILAVVQEDRHA